MTEAHQMAEHSMKNGELLQEISDLKKRIEALEQSESALKRTEHESAILAEIGWLISSTLDIEAVYEQFTAEVRKLITCDRISVDLNNPAESTFTITYVSGFDIPTRRPGDVIPLKGSISEVILRTRTGLLIHPTSVQDVTSLFPAATNISTVRAGMHSMISVPLISRDEVIGTLHLRAKKPNAYAERDLRLAERIGVQIAGAIANTQLFNDLRKTEKSLRESNELFTLFMRHSPIYAYIKEVTPTQSRVLQASENFGEIIGIPGSTMAGKTTAELFPPEFAAKTAANDWAVVSSGNVQTQDEEFNGRCYTTIKFPIILGDKSFLAGYSIDITERKRTEAELLRAQKLESLGVLAGGIAHDFNNLMTVVQGYIGLVLIDLPREHPSRERLRAAMRSVENAKELTSRFITFSRGGGPILEPLDVKEIIRDAVHRTVKKTQMKVNFDFMEDLWFPEADECQIKQCFYNLTTNAVEAMPEGGHLTIRAENVDIPKGDPLPLDAGSHIKITFTDEGVGIPEEHLVKIFDPYFTTKKIGWRKGLGLGLSVCYFVMKQHNGHISVESKPGNGASFSLYLPVRGSATGSKEDQKGDSPRHGPPADHG
jgi:PAS domain S-box-containing protein